MATLSVETPPQWSETTLREDVARRLSEELAQESLEVAAPQIISPSDIRSFLWELHLGREESQHLSPQEVEKRMCVGTLVHGALELIKQGTTLEMYGITQEQQHSEVFVRETLPKLLQLHVFTQEEWNYLSHVLNDTLELELARHLRDYSHAASILPQVMVGVEQDLKTMVASMDDPSRTVEVRGRCDQICKEIGSEKYAIADCKVGPADSNLNATNALQLMIYGHSFLPETDLLIVTLDDGGQVWKLTFANDDKDRPLQIAGELVAHVADAIHERANSHMGNTPSQDQKEAMAYRLLKIKYLYNELSGSISWQPYLPHPETGAHTDQLPVRRDRGWRLTHPSLETGYEKKTHGEVLAALFDAIGVAPKDRHDFLYPRLETLTPELVGLKNSTDPEKAWHLLRAKKILEKAREDNKRVFISGDYDVDGIMSTYLLMRGLGHFGISRDRISYRLPTRQEGYGITTEVIDDALALGQLRTGDILITVDNGIAAHNVIAYAKQKGLQVIVVDHHTIPEEGNPGADAIIHTQQLCATGISYVFLQELLGKKGRDILENYLSIVMLATRADQMPMSTLGNRILDVEGFKRWVTHNNPLLKALEQAAIEEFHQKAEYIDIEKLIQRIIAMINATGRIGDPNFIASALDLTDTPEHRPYVQDAAATMVGNNIERRKLTDHAQRVADKQIRLLGEQTAYIIFSDDIHVGVAGLAASKESEKYGVPAIVGTRFPDGSIRASARGGRKLSDYDRQRGVQDISVIQAIRTAVGACSRIALQEHMQSGGKQETFIPPIGAGGHDGAAACTIHNPLYEELFTQTFLAYVDEKSRGRNKVSIKERKFVCAVPLETILHDIEGFYENTVGLMGPYSNQNPQPVFLSDFTIQFVNDRPTSDYVTVVRLGAGDSEKFVEGVCVGPKAKELKDCAGIKTSFLWTMEKTWDSWRKKYATRVVILDIA